MNELTQRGINALRAGDSTAARSLLSAAVKQDPNDSTAWLWLSGAVEGDDERIQCLEQVLRLDPDNAAAARGLAKTLQKRSIATAAPVAAPPVETAADMVPPESSPAAPAEAAAALPATEAEGEQAASPTTTPGSPTPSATEPAASEPAAMASAVSEAAATEPAAEVPAPARVSGRRKRSKAVKEGAQLIFRTRPSIVIALIGFWVFLAGAAALGYLLRSDLVLALIFGAGLGLVLEAIVIYAIIRNFAVRYELTSQQLTVRFRGKRTRIPVEDIYHAEYIQTFFQRIIGAGDVLIEAVVNGELARLRMRNIPECKRRTDQIKSVINESPA